MYAVKKDNNEQNYRSVHMDVKSTVRKEKLSQLKTQLLR